VLRLRRIAAVAARHGGAHLLGELLDRVTWLSRWRRTDRPSGPVRFRLALEELGGSFVKLGQMLAFQPDLLSLDYCNALYDLLDHVKPFDYADVERIFSEEHGRRPDELFDRIDRQPLAAASVGQVHIAWLAGRKLAVKVQRPAVQEEFEGDIRIMAGTIRIIERLRLRRLAWVADPMREFIAWTREELDYRNEARYMDLLRHNAREQPQEHVPGVLWELTSRRTLTAEFLEGVTAVTYIRAVEHNDEVAIRRMSREHLDVAAFAAHVIDNFLHDSFRHGLFHADLHPANLVILPAGRVGYVDFGITGVLSQYSRRHLIGVTLSLLRGDVGALCDAFCRVATAGPGADQRAFREGLEQLAENWYELRAGRRRLRRKITMVMLDMLVLSRRAGIWPERDVIKFIRSAIAVDGLLARLMPSFDVNDRLETLCAQSLQTEFWRDVLRYETAVLSWDAGNELLVSGVRRITSALRNASTASGSGRGGARRRTERTSSAAGLVLVLVTAAIVAEPTLSRDPVLVATASVAVGMLVTRWIPFRSHRCT
jgi:ubiquinone biosynthesis protein